MAPGPGGSPFRARWDATSVSLYSVVNEPGEIFPLTLYSTLFSGFTTCWWKLFSGKVPLTLYSTLFSRLDEKIIKLFCGKTVGTLSTLLIESEKHLSRNLFSDKEKQKKKTGSADSRRRTRETIRGATEKRAFSLLFFFCFSIYSFSCIVHIGGSW